MGARLKYCGPPRLCSTPTRPDDKSERDRFYSGTAWRKLRLAFLNENPLCAECLKRGDHVPALIVHHKIERLEDADKALDWGNLEALCSPCHTRHHKARRPGP